jgi:delta endotoxin, N-terminal domain
MRVANTMTITSRYKEKVYYWIFKVDDTVYAKSDGSGSLRKDESVTIDVGQNEIKIGFRKGETFFDGWYAEPVRVKPNRSVTLTEKAQISQPDQEEFPNPSQTNSVNFMDNFQDGVQDTTRKIVITALGKIPTIGGAVESLMGYIWPEKKPGVEDLIAASEDRMKAWVHGRIAEYDREFLKNKLGGLRKNLTEYLNAHGPKERQTWMDGCLMLFNEAQGFFLKKNYTAGTLSLAFDLATMHLALLRERVVYKREIFGDEGNLDHFKKALKDTITAYQRFVQEVGIPGEMAWREDMMEIQYSGVDAINQESHLVRDHATREVHLFAKSANRGMGGDQKVLFRYYKQQALNSYRVALQSNIGDPALLWTLLDPDQAGSRPIPLDRVVWIGPCTGLISKKNNEHGANDNEVREDRAGIIKKIYVREYNDVDYLKVFYEGHEGNGVGNAQGGVEHTLELPAGVFIQRVETWWDWELSGIKFDFTNGNSTGKLGDRKGMGHHYQTASYPGHRLSAVRVDGRKCAMWFGFSPRPDYYNAGA